MNLKRREEYAKRAFGTRLSMGMTSAYPVVGGEQAFEMEE